VKGKGGTSSNGKLRGKGGGLTGNLGGGSHTTIEQGGETSPRHYRNEWSVCRKTNPGDNGFYLEKKNPDLWRISRSAMPGNYRGNPFPSIPRRNVTSQRGGNGTSFKYTREGDYFLLLKRSQQGKLEGKLSSQASSSLVVNKISSALAKEAVF